MEPGQIHVLSLGTVLSFFLTSCSDDLAIDDASVDSLESAIQAVGYPCTRVVSLRDLTNDRAGWRVECQGAVAYTATRSSDGSICVMPMPYVDGIVQPGLTNRPRNAIDERCVSPGDI
jgi:hypothetical protein